MSETTETATATYTTLSAEQESGSSTLIGEIYASIRAVLAVGGFDDLNPGSDVLRFALPGDEHYREIKVSLVGDYDNPAIEVVYSGEEGSEYANDNKTVVFINRQGEGNFVYEPGKFSQPPRAIQDLSTTPTNRIGMIIALAVPQNYVLG